MISATKLEILLNATTPKVGFEYERDNGDRYLVSDILERSDLDEKIVILRKLPWPGEQMLCSAQFFTEGRFKRVYNLDAELKSLADIIDIFADNWCYWANNPEKYQSPPWLIQSIPGICQEIKAALVELRRGDRCLD